MAIDLSRYGRPTSSVGALYDRVLKLYDDTRDNPNSANGVIQKSAEAEHFKLSILIPVIVKGKKITVDGPTVEYIVKPDVITKTSDNFVEPRELERNDDVKLVALPIDLLKALEDRCIGVA